MDETYSELFELVGFLLHDDLTTGNECPKTHRRHDLNFCFRVDALCSKRRRRHGDLEDSEKRQKWKRETLMATPHYPAWNLPALKYLYEERKITAGTGFSR